MRTLPLLLCAVLAACTNDPGLTLDIAGTWTDQYDTTHVIDADAWEQIMSTGSSVFEIVEYDNDEDWAIAQNGAANGFSPNLFSRFEWTQVGAQLYFCQVLFDGKTEQAAREAGPADPADPATAGCSGFAWSQLNP